MVNDVNAIFVGFLMTTIGIIWSIQDKPSVQFQKEAGTYSHFMRYMFQAASACLLSVTINLIISSMITAGYFVHALAHKILVLFWIFLHVFALVSCHRVILVFSALSRSENTQN